MNEEYNEDDQQNDDWFSDDEEEEAENKRGKTKQGLSYLAHQLILKNVVLFNGADRFSVYCRKYPEILGEPCSLLRKRAQNRRYYLLELKKYDSIAFSRLCEKYQISLQKNSHTDSTWKELETTGDDSTTNMSSSKRNVKKASCKYWFMLKKHENNEGLSNIFPVQYLLVTLMLSYSCWFAHPVRASDVYPLSR